MERQDPTQKATDDKNARSFRVVSSASEFTVASPDLDPRGAASSSERALESADETSELEKDASEDDGFEDDFLFKSFSLDETNEDGDAGAESFAGGLKSLFETDGGSDDLSDEERFQQELETERRESLDGAILQNDVDFLYEAGEKYERRASADELDSQLGLEVGANGSVSVEKLLEAMLFVGDRDNKPLSLARICQLLRDVSELEALETLSDLNERYFQNGAPYKIVSVDGGFRMVLRSEFTPIAAKFAGKTREFKLSQTAIDVLSLIAYRQPISLEEILDVRANAASALAQLVKRDLIARENKLVGTKKTPYYRTTERFLKVFRLDSLDDLPIIGDIDYR